MRASYMPVILGLAAAILLFALVDRFAPWLLP
jgi:hypothetical protein